MNIGMPLVLDYLSIGISFVSKFSTQELSHYGL
jgi:hypothetical protein